jgi:hypothetical protein
LLTRMTGISLHMHWPLTSQLHGSVSQREQLVFSLWIKLHALIRLGVSPPSFDTCARNGVLCGSQLSHQLISEENWPGRGLNPGLPNDTPALDRDNSYTTTNRRLVKAHQCGRYRMKIKIKGHIIYLLLKENRDVNGVNIAKTWGTSLSNTFVGL